MATRKKSTKGARKIHRVMKEKKEGKLKTRGGRKVTSRKQAVAIALSEARQAGAKIPKKKSSSKKSTGKKRSTTKKKSSRKSSK